MVYRTVTDLENHSLLSPALLELKRRIKPRAALYPAEEIEMDKPGREIPMAERKSVKNSWMENETLVSAAVEAVEARRSLSWNRIFRHGGSTWNDYKLAAAWVSRERKKRDVRTVGNASQLLPSSKAAIALREADLAKEAEKPDVQKDGVTHPNIAYTRPPETSTGNWLKGTAFQFVGLLILIPLGLLFGFQYGGGLIAGIILPLLFVLGVLILVFRYVRAAASSVKSGKPIQKDWHK